jgi:hypothetical protein
MIIVGINKKNEELLKKWEIIVNKIESGYEMTIDDYTNDISNRETIEGILNSLTKKQKKYLTIIDKRFINSTRIIDKPLLGKFSKSKFWWYRIPQKIVGEMVDSYPVAESE